MSCITMLNRLHKSAHLRTSALKSNHYNKSNGKDDGSTNCPNFIWVIYITAHHLNNKVWNAPVHLHASTLLINTEEYFKCIFSLMIFLIRFSSL